MYKKTSVIMAAAITAVLAGSVLAFAVPASASIVIGGNGGSTGAGGSGGSGGNGGINIGAGTIGPSHLTGGGGSTGGTGAIHQEANGGDANGGSSGDANGGDAINIHCYRSHC
jgi:hypothetical protein